jgi:hypothetical protein
VKFRRKQPTFSAVRLPRAFWKAQSRRENMHPEKILFSPDGLEISGVAVQFGEEPRARNFPVAEHSVGRDPDHFRGLLDTQSAEESQLHDALRRSPKMTPLCLPEMTPAF